MYYQLELRPFAKSRTPEAVPIFHIRKSPGTQTMLVLNSGAKIRRKPIPAKQIALRLFRGL